MSRAYRFLWKGGHASSKSKCQIFSSLNTTFLTTFRTRKEVGLDIGVACPLLRRSLKALGNATVACKVFEDFTQVQELVIYEHFEPQC
jgi:hypothetical protein